MFLDQLHNDYYIQDDGTIHLASRIDWFLEL